MSMMSSTARLIAAAGVALAFTMAPVAAADPADLVPVCSGDENPQLDNCSSGCPENAAVSAYGTCTEVGTVPTGTGPSDQTASTGADPDVPLGPQ
ncbi:hypothetical protein [Mycobacterium sp.]|jgi:hypothetical protein|uniref:hypothetical protein n=1 Tax=Mycobacterium sp. TaxID=1785 RepID=UPI003C78A547